MIPGLYGIGGFTVSDNSVTLVHSSASENETANFGADVPGRWIVILPLGGNAVASYNLSVTVNGISATQIERHSTGDGAGLATGTGIFVAQPSGSSGTVAIGGTPGVRRFYVLRVVDYDLSSAIWHDNSAGSGIPPWSANVPANGLCIGVIQNSFGGDIVWTGLTERVSGSLNIVKLDSVAWDTNMAADASKSIDVTASDTNGQTSACIATFAHV